MRLTSYFVFKVLVLVGLGSNLATSADVFVHTLDFLKPINDPVSPAKSIFSKFRSFSDCSNYVQNKNGRLLRKRMTGIEPTTSSGNRASWQTATHWSGGKCIPMGPRKKHDYSNRTHDLADHQPLIIASGLKTTTRFGNYLKDPKGDCWLPAVGFAASAHRWRPSGRSRFAVVGSAAVGVPRTRFKIQIPQYI